MTSTEYTSLDTTVMDSYNKDINSNQQTNALLHPYMAMAMPFLLSHEHFLLTSSQRLAMLQSSETVALSSSADGNEELSAALDLTTTNCSSYKKSLIKRYHGKTE
ncbi:hypothetical protein EB796_024086 [Bugula neritina]|uniref:Uncharacterized protein n=1 Tax=Bugula neritina TaxID=10212 RepID=A0A7J7IUW0_BUGNE|nr:hypothetical protein EB796_024086 [Bugula neritina]